MTKSFHVTCLAVLFTFLSIAGFAQWTTTSDIIPPSPTAASLARYAQMPVTLYGGLADITIPIYEAAVRDVTVPITLSYHCSGIKVNEESSWVGLGWSLNAGGVITSVVRGKSDVGSGGLINTPTSTVKRSAVPTCNTTGTVALSSTCTHCTGTEPADADDWEPDLFYFNFLGKTGTFIYSQGATPSPLLVEDELMKIEKTASGWTVTASNGTIYTFNQTEVCTAAGTAVTNTWYLTGITSILNETVTFTYATTGTEYQNMYFDIDRINRSGSVCANTATWVGSSPTLSYATRYLSKITFSTGYIDFITGSSRLDLPAGKSLNSIKVYRTDNTLVKQFDFTYSHFTSTLTTTNYRATVAGQQDVTRRLKLDQVQEKNPVVVPALSIKPYVFTYNFDGSTTSKMLPAKTSYAFDHWGLYNGATSNLRLLPAATLGTRTNAANRTASATTAQACMLTQVAFPTGSKTTYEYELNTSTNCTGNLTGGGLRIFRITDDDGTATNNIVKTYNYASGLLLSCPSYDRTVSRSFTCPGATTCDYTEGRANTLLSVSRSGIGNPIGYSTVTILQGTGGNGKTEQNYSNTADNAPMNPFPGIPVTANALNGTLTSTIVYSWTGSAFLKVKETIKTYTLKPGSTFTYGMVKETLPVPSACTSSDCSRKKFVSFYQVQSDWVVPATSKEREYKYNDGTLYTEVTTDYEFNSTSHKQLSRLLKTESNGSKTGVEYVYPLDYTTANTWITNMKNNYVHNEPIERITYDNCGGTCKNVVSGEVSVFASTGKPVKTEGYLVESATPLNITTSAFALSNSTGSFAMHSSYVRRMVMDYDGNNNLKQATKVTGTTAANYDFRTSYLFGYGASAATGVLPVAQVSNAASNTVAYTSFEKSYAEGGWSYTVSNITTDAKTGVQCSNPLTLTYNSIPNISKPYRVSLWVKNSSGSAKNVTINGGTAIVVSVPVSGSWQLVERNVTPTAANLTVNAATGMLMDEVRLHPADAQMSTSTYDPMVGATSTNTVNNITSSVEYDGLGRKKYLRDQDKYIRQTFDYVEKP